MIANNKFSVVAAMFFIGIVFQYAEDACAATNDKLDVNLNVLYVGTKSQKDSNALSEIIVQFPFPLTDKARITGEGPFGGITYYDNKSLVDINNRLAVTINPQLVTEMGVGRIYYSTSVPGETPYTFVICHFFPSVFVWLQELPGKLHRNQRQYIYAARIHVCIPVQRKNRISF